MTLQLPIFSYFYFVELTLILLDMLSYLEHICVFPNRKFSAEFFQCLFVEFRYDDFFIVVCCGEHFAFEIKDGALPVVLQT